MIVRLLEPVQMAGPAGPAVLSGGRQRALVSALAINAGLVVPSSRLVTLCGGRSRRGQR